MPGIPPLVAYPLVLLSLSAIAAFQTWQAIDKFLHRIDTPPLLITDSVAERLVPPQITVCSKAVDLHFDCFLGASSRPVQNCNDNYFSSVNISKWDVSAASFDRCWTFSTQIALVAQDSSPGPLYYPFNIQITPANTPPKSYKSVYAISLSDPTESVTVRSIFASKVIDAHNKLLVGFKRSEFVPLDKSKISLSTSSTLAPNFSMEFQLIDVTNADTVVPDSDWFAIGVYPLQWRLETKTEVDPYPLFVFLSNLAASWGMVIAIFFGLLGRGRYNPGGMLQQMGIVDSRLGKYRFTGKNKDVAMDGVDDPAAAVVGLYLDGADKLIVKQVSNKRASYHSLSGVGLLQVPEDSSSTMARSSTSFTYIPVTSVHPQ